MNEDNDYSDFNEPVEVPFGTNPYAAFYSNDDSNFCETDDVESDSTKQTKDAKKSISNKKPRNKYLDSNLFFKIFLVATLVLITIFFSFSYHIVKAGYFKSSTNQSVEFEPNVNVDNPVNNEYQFNPSTNNSYQNNFYLDIDKDLIDKFCNCS